ncbi:hypothetical protein SKAU_G00084590 [Synaphobranchus kaupii]|uniref:Uncharacterized protein n=1 Tax=Synaphobranchus kaupii TaxID=118154 RepID=A0A9Q1J5V0_SYNKA|nr:hypothetical protein SKAU_G00084590 [Synaphobranchus kaupii]
MSRLPPVAVSSGSSATDQHWQTSQCSSPAAATEPVRQNLSVSDQKEEKKEEEGARRTDCTPKRELRSRLTALPSVPGDHWWGVKVSEDLAPFRNDPTISRSPPPQSANTRGLETAQGRKKKGQTRGQDSLRAAGPAVQTLPSEIQLRFQTVRVQERALYGSCQPLYGSLSEGTLRESWLIRQESQLHTEVNMLPRNMLKEHQCQFCDLAAFLEVFQALRQLVHIPTWSSTYGVKTLELGKHTAEAFLVTARREQGRLGKAQGPPPHNRPQRLPPTSTEKPPALQEQPRKPHVPSVPSSVGGGFREEWRALYQLNSSRDTDPRSRSQRGATRRGVRDAPSITAGEGWKRTERAISGCPDKPSDGAEVSIQRQRLALAKEGRPSYTRWGEEAPAWR